MSHYFFPVPGAVRIDVEVELPAIGLTDVLPFPGEFALGDICIDH